ncbi:MAG: archaetidylserine decarboxylase [Leptospiraceae bacterium]|nr:archaetidylserine decarboxylase [Leptospiraceae bacterium]MDW7976936.1 archaetidylserine decarboxylase [Leptospiraceae bacterium]
MFSLKLVNGIIYPYFLMFLLASLFLLFYYRFLILRYFLLSIKIISGVLDWKGSRGKITPGRAFFAGIVGSFFPGQVVGLSVALVISEPPIVILLMIFHFLQTSLEFVLSAMSFKFRYRNESGNLETGLILGIDKYSRIRWFGILYGLFFGVLSIFYGIWNLSFVEVINQTFYQRIDWKMESSSIMILFLIFLILIFNGGIRRIGVYAKIQAYVLLLVVILSLLIIPEFFSFFASALKDFSKLFHKENFDQTISATILYFLFAEVPSYKLNIFSGFVRTNYSAKQGIATLLYPILQSLALILFSPVIYEILKNSSIPFSSFSDLPQLIFFLHTSLISSFILGFSSEPYLDVVIWAMFFSLVFSSFLTWFFSGNLILRQVLFRFHLPNFYPVVVILIFLYFIFFFYWENEKVMYVFYLLFLFLSGIVGIFSIIFALIYHILGKFELQKYEASYEGGVDFSRDLFVLLFAILPSNLISKIFGYFSLIRFPQPLMKWIILVFTKIYKINLSEIKKDLKEFRNLNEFFIRELKEEVRPIDRRKKILVSPVDATIIRRGTINEGFLIQAKDVYYTLKDLLVDPDYLPVFEGGRYIVLYLSPQDYHRIHAPYDCIVEGYTYSPGNLFPVNEPAVEGMHGLFPKNERLTTFLRTRFGRIAMVKVGATNVGRIRILYDSIRTNAWIRRKKAVRYPYKILFKKGQEIARFEMGSTVILIFEKNTVEFLETAIEGIKVKYGEKIARFQTPWNTQKR